MDGQLPPQLTGLVTGTTTTPAVPVKDSPDAVGAFLSVLARRYKLCVALFLFTVAAVVVLTLLAPKQYTTHVKFLAGATAAGDDSSGSGQTSLPILNALLAASGGQSPETYAELVRGSESAERVIAFLHLPMAPGDLLGHVKVRPVTNTSIIDVSVTWKSAERSATVANAFASTFVELRRQLIAHQADSAITQLNGQLPAAEDAMRKADSALTSFQTRSGIADVQQQTQNVVNNANLLDVKLAGIEVDEQQAEASLQSAQAQLTGTPPFANNGGSTQPNPVAALLKAQLAEVSVQLKNARAKYTEEYPLVKELEEQQQHVLGEIALQPRTTVAMRATIANPVYTQLMQLSAQLRGQIASDRAQIAQLRKERSASDPVIGSLPRAAQRYTDLKREASFAQGVYNALRQKLNDAIIAKTTALSDVTVIERASPYEAGVSPSFMMNLLLGFVLAITVAIVGALVIDYLDGGVKTEDEVEGRIGMPLLGTFPALGSRARPAWLQSVMVESSFHLATSLRYAAGSQLRTIAFTSAGQGEGKSTLALNTALAYAELRPRVLLVDADLRLPSLHRKLHIDNERGLSDILVGTAALADAIQPTKHAGLDVVTSGPPSANPLRLLQLASFDRFLESVKTLYEVIVIDATACGGLADAAVTSIKCDGTVFVIASGDTEIRAARRAMAKLQTAGVRNVIGAVLNRVKPRRSEISAYRVTGTNGARAIPLSPHRGA